MANSAPTIHIAGPAVTINERWMRQRCAWCGEILADYDLGRIAVPEWAPAPPVGWPEGALVMTDGALSYTVEAPDDHLPDDSCARVETSALLMGDHGKIR